MALVTDLQAYYQCNDASDTMGNHPATFNSVAVGSGTGKFGDSWDFTSVAAYVSLASPTPNTSTFTAMAWAYNLRPDSAYRTLFYNGVGGGSGGMHFITEATTALAGTYANTAFTSTGTALVAASYTGWHHYAVVGSGGTFTLYVDGVSIGAVTPTWPGTFEIAQIGGDSYGEGFAERLDDVAIWNRALSVAEITQIYTAYGPIASLLPSAVVPNITGTVAALATFDGSGSTGAVYHRWTWQVIPGGSVIGNALTPYPDNQATTPIDMTDNEGLWHFEQGPSSYSQDFESTSVGSLPTGFTTSGDANWEVETGDDVAGTGKAAVSQDINDNQESIMEYTTILAVDSVIEFYWKCSSEPNWDHLEFKIDGVQQAQINGTVAWTQVSFAAAAGSRTFTWRYYKDGAVSTGDDNGKVDQIVIREATSLADSSGNGNSAINDGAVFTSASKIGSGAYEVTTSTAMGFGAASNYLSASDSFTVAFWHKSTASSQALYDAVFGWSNGFSWTTGAGAYWENTSTLRFFVGRYNTVGDYVDITVSNPTLWNHYALKYDGSNVTVYLNGVQAGQSTKTGVLTGLSETFQIGKLGTREQCEGIFDELAIWKRALTAQEVSDIYFLQNAPNAGIGTTNTFTPDVNGTYTIQLDVGGGSTVNADAVISAAPPPASGSGETFQGLNFQGDLNPKIQGS